MVGELECVGGLKVVVVVIIGHIKVLVVAISIVNT
jgi:hypothetical protein